MVTERFMSQLAAFELIPSKAHRNLEAGEMARLAVERKEGEINSTGSLSVNTGKYTGRSPDDRFIVYDERTRNTVDWGKINHRFSSEGFGRLLRKMREFVAGREVFVFDGFVGADPGTRLPIRVINDHVWQSLFARNLFICPTREELECHEPEFTILCINDFEAVPEADGTRSNAFILIDLTRKIVLIGGTRYAGEMKKSMFSVMNFLLPERGIFPMHCSANIGRAGDTALFFGLSGTGKTTLSADPNRRLIGDDEHGWSDEGTFNFEGGCYAKCINLDREAEPEIWNAIRPGAVLENVVTRNGVPDYDDSSLTENTRVAYPLDFIPGAVIPSVGGDPRVIVFLTADALGVLPPISRLTREGGDVSLYVRVYQQACRHGAWNQGAQVGLLRMLRGPVHAQACGRVCGTARRQDCQARHRRIPGQHGLVRRAVRNRQAGQDQVQPCHDHRRTLRHA